MIFWNKIFLGNGLDQGTVEDPLQMLQELITDGSLIKEAVKRLQDGLFRNSTKTFYESEDDEGGCTPDL